MISVYNNKLNILFIQVIIGPSALDSLADKTAEDEVSQWMQCPEYK